MENRGQSTTLETDLSSAQSTNHKVFNQLLVSVAIVLTFYCFYFNHIHSYLASFFMALGVILLSPLAYYINQSGKSETARLLFVISCNFYIYSASMALGHKPNNELFLIPAMMLSMLLFDFRQPIHMAFCIAAPILNWSAIKFGHLIKLPIMDVPGSINIEQIKHVNFMGAAATTMTFLYIILKNNREVEFRYSIEQEAQKRIQFALDEKSRSEAQLKVTAYQMKMAMKQLEDFFTSSPDLMAIAKEDGYFRKTNPSFSKILGYTEEELKTTPFIKFIHPEDLLKSKHAIRRVVRGETVSNIELRFRAKDGSYRAISWSSQHTPEMNIIYGVGRDVTDMIQNKKENEILRDQLEEAQETAKIGSWKYFIDTEKMLCSKQMVKLLGHGMDGSGPGLKDIESHIHADDLQTWNRFFKKCQNSIEIQKCRIRVTRDHEINWIEATGHGKKSFRRHLNEISGTFREITDEVNTEIALELERAKTIQSAKLATLGEMAASIAHEINNPLSIIHGSAILLPRFRDNEEKFLSKIDTINKATDRISKIVNGLRKFSRSSDKSEKTLNSLTQIVKESLILTEHKTKRNNVTIDLVSSGDASVICNEIEIEQIVVNMINNSIDAVKELKNRWIKLEVIESWNEVILRISDSGEGIKPEIVDRIFDPFYTTKPVGEGTGLGLSIVRGILEDHDATISILQNQPNTCFEIRFLKAKPEQAAA